MRGTAIAALAVLAGGVLWALSGDDEEGGDEPDQGAPDQPDTDLPTDVVSPGQPTAPPPEEQTIESETPGARKMSQAEHDAYQYLLASSNPAVLAAGEAALRFQGFTVEADKVAARREDVSSTLAEEGEDEPIFQYTPQQKAAIRRLEKGDLDGGFAPLLGVVTHKPKDVFPGVFDVVFAGGPEKLISEKEARTLYNRGIGYTNEPIRKRWEILEIVNKLRESGYPELSSSLMHAWTLANG